MYKINIVGKYKHGLLFSQELHAPGKKKLLDIVFEGLHILRFF